MKFLRTTVLTNFEASITITLLDTKLNLGKVADHTTINAQYGNTGCGVFKWGIQNKKSTYPILNFENWTNGEPQ